MTRRKVVRMVVFTSLEATMSMNPGKGRRTTVEKGAPVHPHRTVDGEI